MNKPDCMRGVPWTDQTGECISVDPATGLVRIDGVPVFKVFTIGSTLHIQFKDGDKLRSKYRGTDLIEVSLKLLIKKITEGCT